MGKCVIKNCLSRSEKVNKASGVTFHRIPKDHKRLEIWIKNIRLLRKDTDWLPSASSVICSKHFKDKDFILPKHDKGHIRLSDKAVPMIIDETESPMDISIETDDEMLQITESPRKHKMRKTINRSNSYTIIIMLADPADVVQCPARKSSATLLFNKGDTLSAAPPTGSNCVS